MRHHHNHEDPRQVLIPFPQERFVTVKYELGNFDNPDLRRRARENMMGIFGGNGEKIPARELIPAVRHSISDTLSLLGLDVSFNEGEIVIKPNFTDEESAYDAGGYRRH